MIGGAFGPDLVEELRDVEHLEVRSLSKPWQHPALVSGAVGHEEAQAFARVLVEEAGDVREMGAVDGVPAPCPQFAVEPPIVDIQFDSLGGVVGVGVNPTRIVYGSAPFDGGLASPWS